MPPQTSEVPGSPRPVGGRAFLASSHGAGMGGSDSHLELEEGVTLSVETWLFLLFSGFGCRLGGERESGTSGGDI